MSELKEASAAAAQDQITAEEIIRDITSVKDIEEMREDLRTMWDNFVIWNDTTDADDRGSVYCTYKALYDALGKMQEYEEQRILETIEEAIGE